MRYGINLPPFGDFGYAHTLAELAREAEQAGWDGFFIWDHMMFDPTFHPIVDPWVGLTAMALATQRIRLGTMITPIARRRPWKLARETVSVDQLSHGRLTLGVGLGEPVQWDFGFFHEPVDARIRARKLDEGLEVLTGLWSAKPFRYQGEHYQLEEVIFRPGPVQSPRIPIWVGGWWPNKRPMRRAANWDGVMPLSRDKPLTPDDWRDILAYIHEHRQSQEPFDAVHAGETPGDDPGQATAIVDPYAEAGVTWWLESVHPWRYGWRWEDPWSPEATARIYERVRQGPPGAIRNT